MRCYRCGLVVPITVLTFCALCLDDFDLHPHLWPGMRPEQLQLFDHSPGEDL